MDSKFTNKYTPNKIRKKQDKTTELWTQIISL